MSGTEQWLPFFEQVSEQRRVEDWYDPIQSTLTKFGLKVRHLVSDRAKALIKQFETNPNLKLKQMNQLLISFYDDRPWLVRRTTAKFNKDENQWNFEVKKLIEELNLSVEIDRIENEINEETGYNKL